MLLVVLCFLYSETSCNESAYPWGIRYIQHIVLPRKVIKWMSGHEEKIHCRSKSREQTESRRNIETTRKTCPGENASPPNHTLSHTYPLKYNTMCIFHGWCMELNSTCIVLISLEIPKHVYKCKKTIYT